MKTQTIELVKKDIKNTSLNLSVRVASIIKEMRGCGHFLFGKIEFTKEQMGKIDQIYKSLKADNSKVDLLIEFYEIVGATDAQLIAFHGKTGL
jgi:hypothetical protein